MLLQRHMGQTAVSLAALLGAAVTLAGGCGAPEGAEEIGTARQADMMIIGQAGDPHINAQCAGTPTMERHGSAAGVCAAGEFGLDDAVVACGGRKLKYYSYSCADFPNPPHHGWTSYFSCCCSGTGISFESRYLPPGTPDVTSADDAVALFESLSAPSGYGYAALYSTASFSNHASIPGGSTKNIASHLKVSFYVDQAHEGLWRFRLGPDYGRGGLLRVGGEVLMQRWPNGFPPNYDFYWSGDWNNTDRILKGDKQLTMGWYDVEAYGLENCCDASFAPPEAPQMRLEFSPPGAVEDWHPFPSNVLLCGKPGALGDSCIAGAQCASGHCIDGVCCDTTCEGTCKACTAEKKGSGADGTCGFVAAGLDPGNECPSDAFCGNGCNGQGACNYKRQGQACGLPNEPYCQGGIFYFPVCDGHGSCDPDYVWHDCGNYGCDYPYCKSSCSSNNDCATNHVCDLSTHTCLD